MGAGHGDCDAFSLFPVSLFNSVSDDPTKRSDNEQIPRVPAGSRHMALALWLVRPLAASAKQIDSGVQIDRGTDRQI